jgi:replicative DNA helicase
MYENKLSIDVLTLTTFLQEKDYYKKIGGIKVLLELINQIQI